MEAHSESESHTLGHVIRRRRIELGLTQEELAERVGESVRQSDISRMERDYVSLPRRERLEALASALEVTPGYLLMHSGWAANADLLHVDASRDNGELADLLADAREPGALQAAGGKPRVPIQTRAGQSRDAARLLRARQDVIAANRELTRAIDALTAANQQEPNGSTGASENGEVRDEELDELNRKLRGVIDQLNARNDDLEARSIELRAAVLAAENARVQLSAIMNAVGDNVVVVDKGQSIVLQSHSVAEALGADVGALTFLDEAGNPLEGNDSPLAKVARGERFATSVQVATPQGDIRTFEVVGRPSGVIGGHRLGVLTLRSSAG